MYCRLRTEGLERVFDATLTSKCRSPREIELYRYLVLHPYHSAFGRTLHGYALSCCDQTSQPRCKRQHTWKQLMRYCMRYDRHQRPRARVRNRTRVYHTHVCTTRSPRDFTPGGKTYVRNAENVLPPLLTSPNQQRGQQQQLRRASAGCLAPRLGGEKSSAESNQDEVRAPHDRS